MKEHQIQKTNEEQVLELYCEKTPVLKFKLFQELDLIEHCFTTRMGGVSNDIYTSMNLSFSRGDKQEAVMENYKRIADTLHVDISDFVCSDQTHTTNVMRVGQKEAGCGVTKERPYRNIDALVTNERKVVLSTFYADCVPLYFVDPVHRAIGLAHSGWRGTVGRIGQKTIQTMTREFGSEPKDIYAAIGPSICKECYEIGKDVADEFLAAFPNAAESILCQKNEEKFQLDLWKCNEIVLKEAGISEEHMAITNICTCCNPDFLFSHRASNGKRGNLGAFIYLL